MIVSRILKPKQRYGVLEERDWSQPWCTALLTINGGKTLVGRCVRMEEDRVKGRRTCERRDHNPGVEDLERHAIVDDVPSKRGDLVSAWSIP